MRWWWEKGELRKRDLQETLRVEFDVKDPKSVENEFLGFAKNKLYGMAKDTNKRITLADGTRIFIKADEWNPKIFIEKPFKEIEKRKKRKQREVISTYPAPVLCCYSFLPSVGNQHENAVPELFLVMPYFKRITHVVKPRKIDEASEELYQTYAKYYDVWEMWKGKCQLNIDDTMVPFNEELPRNERRKITIKELVNISDITEASSDLYGNSSGTSNYEYIPDFNAEIRQTLYTATLESRIYAFGLAESSSWRNDGHSWEHLVGSYWIQDYATALSVGKHTTMGIRIITNPEISNKFQSKQSAYMYSVEYRHKDNFQESPIVAGSGIDMDSRNKVPEFVEYYLKTQAPNYSKEIKLWDINTVQGTGETYALYSPDVKIYDFHGEPVFLLCWMPYFYGTVSPAYPNSNMIRYMMIYKNEVYESEWYPKIGSMDYPHIVYTGGNKTYYCSGFMRLVEVEEKTIVEEEDL